MLETQKEMASKTLYAAIGAPVLAGRKMKDVGTRIADYGTKVADGTKAGFTAAADEGERVAQQFQDRKVVEDIQARVDFEKVQDRVEQLRDQLEHAMSSWRENFHMGDSAKAEQAEEIIDEAVAEAVADVVGEVTPEEPAVETTGEEEHMAEEAKEDETAVVPSEN